MDITGHWKAGGANHSSASHNEAFCGQIELARVAKKDGEEKLSGGRMGPDRVLTDKPEKKMHQRLPH